MSTDNNFEEESGPFTSAEKDRLAYSSPLLVKLNTFTPNNTPVTLFPSTEKKKAARNSLLSGEKKSRTSSSTKKSEKKESEKKEQDCEDNQERIVQLCNTTGESTPGTKDRQAQAEEEDDLVSQLGSLNLGPSPAEKKTSNARNKTVSETKTDTAASTEVQVKAEITQLLQQQPREAFVPRSPLTVSPSEWTPFALPAALESVREIILAVSPRLVFFDTETTGLSKDDRVVEIGAVLRDYEQMLERRFHAFVNPEGRKIGFGAYQAHRLSSSFLRQMKTFREIAPMFLDFIEEYPLVAHHAKFDKGMVNNELERCKAEKTELNARKNKIFCSMRMAESYRGRGNNKLDDLCEHYQVDLSLREERHGALEDSLLLADVFSFILSDATSMGDAIGHIG